MRSWRKQKWINATTNCILNYFDETNYNLKIEDHAHEERREAQPRDVEALFGKAKKS